MMTLCLKRMPVLGALLLAAPSPEIAAATFRAIELTSSDFSMHTAWGIKGTQIVGYGSDSFPEGNYHALLWNGASSSAIDLHPSDYTLSLARCVAGDHQGGGAEPQEGPQF